MNVRALFLSCDRDVLKTYMRELECGMSEGELSDFIAEAEKCEPVISEERIVLGAEYICGELPPRIEITAYNISALKSGFRPFAFSDNSLSDDEAERLSEIIFACSGTSAELMPLGELFGCDICEENISLLGRERFTAELLCAAAFYSSTSADKPVGAAAFSSSSNEKNEGGISLDEMAALLFGGGGYSEVSEPAFSAESIANMLSTYRSLKMFFESI